MTDQSLPTAPVGASTTKAAKYQAAKVQFHQRVQRYRRRIMFVALFGFGSFSLLIAKPDLGLGTLLTTLQTTTQTSSDSSNSFFTQQGGNTNAGTSQQAPVTTTNRS